MIPFTQLYETRGGNGLVLPKLAKSEGQILMENEWKSCVNFSCILFSLVSRSVEHSKWTTIVTMRSGLLLICGLLLTPASSFGLENEDIPGSTERSFGNLAVVKREEQQQVRSNGLCRCDDELNEVSNN